MKIYVSETFAVAWWVCYISFYDFNEFHWHLPPLRNIPLSFMWNSWTGSSVSSCHLLVVVENTYLHPHGSLGNDCVDECCEIKSIFRKQGWSNSPWFIPRQYWEVSFPFFIIRISQPAFIHPEFLMKEDSSFAWFHLCSPCALGKHLPSVIPFSSSHTLYSSSE